MGVGIPLSFHFLFITTRYTVHGRGAKTLRLCKFTTNHNTQSSRFFNFFINWRNPRQEHVFSRVQKRCPKVDPKQRAFTVDMYTMATFFQLLKNPVFKTPLLSGTCPPPYIRFAKSNYFPNGRTDGRTDGRNIWFWLADGRKERFAQKQTLQGTHTTVPSR